MGNRILGLDLGIGSIGWAVVDEDLERILDLGVRIFESGEEGASKAADRASQQRRQKRSIHRQTRRRRQRKERLKAVLEGIGLISKEAIHEAYRSKGFNPEVFAWRNKGLTEKLSPIEITAILINLANYRGYKDFYEGEGAEEGKESQLKEAQSRVCRLFEESHYETVGQMIYLSPEFRYNGHLSIRNNGQKDSSGKKKTQYRNLIPREYLYKEAEILLNRQAEYYSCLSPDNCGLILAAIFSQRCFEEGPGPNKEKSLSQRQAMLKASKGRQVYSGFEELIGQCPFFPAEKRGSRNSQLFDMFMLINSLSQLHFFKDQKEIFFSGSYLEELRQIAFEKKGTITFKELDKFCKQKQIELIKSEGFKGKTNFVVCKYIQFLCNPDIFPPEQIQHFREEAYDDAQSISWRLGIILTRFATPSRRESEIKALLSKEAMGTGNLSKLKVQRMPGAASVSDTYMLKAVDAYRNGQLYGDFQAEILLKQSENSFEGKALVSKGKIRPIADPDLIRNPVVYRTLNEARKLINVIQKTYPGITQINIEVARDVGQSFEERAAVSKRQKDRERDNQKIREDLIQELEKSYKEVGLSDKLLTKYRLWMSQQKHCLYSGAAISFEELLTNEVQVDHIIPQSIVLDETINNKVLVKTVENQHKGNRLPLEYMSQQQGEDFKNRVANLKRNSLISAIKERYLLLDSLDSEDGQTAISGFVERNLNDTRYICKYVSNFLKKAYEGKVEIMMIRGSITSRFRRVWLDRNKEQPLLCFYGLGDKGRDLHYYHHTVDAVVLANLKRAYIEIAQDYLKITGLTRERDRMANCGCAVEVQRINQGIHYELENSIGKMQKYYGFSPSRTRELLEQGWVPSICTCLRKEVEARIPLLVDWQAKGYQDYLLASRNLRPYLLAAVVELRTQKAAGAESFSLPDELVEEINQGLSQVYPKYCAIDRQGMLFPQEETDKDKKVLLLDVFAKLAERPLSDFIDSLEICPEETYQQRVEEFYRDQDFAEKIKIPYVSFKIDRRFRGGMLSSDNPVSLEKTGYKTFLELEAAMKTDLRCPYYVRFNKGIGELGNFTVYEARCYYCLEIFLNPKQNYEIRGIRYVDLYKKDGKLVLRKPLPEGYQHVAYLFNNEYIKVFDKKGKVKNNGFGAYRSIENVNQNTAKIRLFSNYGLNGRDRVIKVAAPVKKVEISLLGHILGEVRCGDQSLFIRAND